MPGGMMGWIARLALPARSREAVLGDLEEEMGAGFRRLAALLGIVLYYHAAPYRDRAARFAVLALLAAGVALLWAVHRAAWPGAFPPHGYDPMSELVLQFWAAPHLVAAVAVGLFTGRFDTLPDGAEPVRAHVAAAQAGVAALLAPGGGAGALAAGLILLAAAGIGGAARTDAVRAASTAPLTRPPRASSG